ncbi:hypothetical protein ACIA8R_26480 [Nonomuraea sp. NPDC051191]|uniref:hypothetical protein n=1 Tax=Nonomuraea sp. NPDC051191 TaxID=3364372 RepID=UPI003791F79E
MTSLERRYRRLLVRWYPAEHRALHEEEMIAVLVAGAEPGRRRPGVRDTFDLVRGGLAIRVRRGAGAQWRAAVDAAALLVPVALLLTALARAAMFGAATWQRPFVADEFPQFLRMLTYALPYAVVVVLAWRGKAGAAAVCAWAYALVTPGVRGWVNASFTSSVTGDGVLLIGGVPFDFGGMAISALPLVLCGAMLLLAPSPGPGPLGGRRLLWWMAVLLGAAAAGAAVSSRWAYPPMWALAVVAAGLALRSPVGRRALVVLLPMVGVYVGGLPGAGYLLNAVLLSVPAMVVLGVTSWMARVAGQGAGAVKKGTNRSLNGW